MNPLETKIILALIAAAAVMSAVAWAIPFVWLVVKFVIVIAIFAGIPVIVFLFVWWTWRMFATEMNDLRLLSLVAGIVGLGLYFWFLAPEFAWMDDPSLGEWMVAVLVRNLSPILAFVIPIFLITGTVKTAKVSVILASITANYIRRLGWKIRLLFRQARHNFAVFIDSGRREPRGKKGAQDFNYDDFFNHDFFKDADWQNEGAGSREEYAKEGEQPRQKREQYKPPPDDEFSFNASQYDKKQADQMRKLKAIINGGADEGTADNARRAFNKLKGRTK